MVKRREKDKDKSDFAVKETVRLLGIQTHKLSETAVELGLVNEAKRIDSLTVSYVNHVEAFLKVNV